MWPLIVLENAAYLTHLATLWTVPNTKLFLSRMGRDSRPSCGPAELIKQYLAHIP